MGMEMENENDKNKDKDKKLKIIVPYDFFPGEQNDLIMQDFFKNVKPFHDNESETIWKLSDSKFSIKVKKS